MISRNFIKNCMRSNSDLNKESSIRLDFLKDALEDCVRKNIYLLNKLDTLKKCIFYGKDFNAPDDFKGKNKTTNEDFQKIHAIVGIATESCELLEALYDNLNGQNWDTVNLIEECGDLLWYQALLLKECGTDFEDASNRVIRKLKSRYPEKFSEKKRYHKRLKN